MEFGTRQDVNKINKIFQNFNEIDRNRDLINPNMGGLFRSLFFMGG